MSPKTQHPEDWDLLTRNPAFCVTHRKKAVYRLIQYVLNFFIPRKWLLYNILVLRFGFGRNDELSSRILGFKESKRSATLDFCIFHFSRAVNRLKEKFLIMSNVWLWSSSTPSHDSSPLSCLPNKTKSQVLHKPEKGSQRWVSSVGLSWPTFTTTHRSAEWLHCFKICFLSPHLYASWLPTGVCLAKLFEQLDHNTRYATRQVSV